MKKQIALFTVLLVLLSNVFFPQKAAAADGSITISASLSGQTVTVNVGVSPTTEMNNFDCSISYESNVVEFVSGTSGIGAVSSANSGGVIAIARDIGATFSVGHVATLTFRVKGSGNITFTAHEGSGVSTYDLERDGYTFMGGAKASVNIQNTPAVTPTNTVANTDPPQTPLTTIETLPATTTDARETEETKSQPTKVLKAVDHKGRRLSIPDIDLEDADIPSGFEAAERVIDGSGLSGYYSETEDLFLSFLSLSGQEPQLYFYNSSSKSFIPYLRFKLGDEYYHVTLMPDELIPYGTTRSDAEIREVNLPVIEFNFGDYVSFDEYMKQYQAELSKSGPAASLSGQTDSTAGGNIAKMDIEIDREKAATYLLALVGGNKEIERFLYSQNLDQIMHYDLLLVPAFGTFLDEDFDNLAKEDPQGAVMQTETVTSAAEIASSDLNERQQGLRSRTVKLFGRDFELWQIIAASGGVLLILIILIIIIIKLNSDRKKAEYPFADDFLADDNVPRAEDDSFKASDEADAANISPVSYNYLTDLSEVRDVSDIGVKAEQSIGMAYQKKSKGNERFSTYADRSDLEDQEEI